MALSEMMTHWSSIKEKYNDCVVFYRLGDFYEMFFDDAVEASDILELTLTGRDCGLSERAPMCGIPYHAAEGYIAKLVEHGKKVAICEQLTEPGAQKGLVERDVIRVVTSGTLIEEASLDEKKNNFIASVTCSNDYFGVSWADITTGEFFTEQIENSLDKLIDALSRINPSEIIADEKSYKLSSDLSIIKSGILPQITLNIDSFSESAATDTLTSKFGVKSLDAFLPCDKTEAINAAAALIRYLKKMQKHMLKNLESISYYDDGSVLLLDSSALRNLEIVRSMRDGRTYGSLLWSVDFTSTSMGARKLRTVLTAPLRDIEKINYRNDGVEALFNDTLLREGIIDILKGVKDLERLCGKVSNNVLTPKDIRVIIECLLQIVPIQMQLVGVKSQILTDIYKGLGDYEELVNLLNSAVSDNPPMMIKECGFVRVGYDAELDKYRELKQNGGNYIKEMESTEREKTGIKNLKIGYNRVFGYYIEVSNSFKNLAPYHYIRKQTLVGGERFVTEELKKIEEEIFSCEERIIKIETRIYNHIKGVLMDNLSKLMRTSRSFAMLDVLCSMATVAKKRRFVKPTICAPNCAMQIVGGRHPVVEAVSKEQFISNDTVLDNSENRTMIITGPNMAGKSTYMRQVALIAILAQCGSFVPAKSVQMPICDRVFTRVGASDNLIFNQSTFMVEMTEVAKILRNATKDSLLILDEVGRGTSTFDGLSIAWAVVEYITQKISAKTLFATHYHELSELENIMDGIKNYKINVKEFNGSIVFLRKIARGSANKSFGIEVASLAGVPNEVGARAKAILKKLEKNDLAFNFNSDCEVEPEKPTSAIEEYIKKINVNALSPLQAFEILVDLKGKIDDAND